MGQRVLGGKSRRAVFTPALGALALVGGLAAGIGSFATQAHAEDAKPSAAVEAGRELFNTWSCSACHTLTDAGSSGAVGPSLDNPKLTHDFIVNRVTNGQGPMPSFGGQIDEADIAKLADYIVAVNHKDAPAVAAASTSEQQNH
uniref:c-type cytochrome n=1 Tax=Altererythrobacter segetis TaxID=1104773 RepID=UPI001A9C894F|nr:cytochrome c [Altererythrobacter segetis]